MIAFVVLINLLFTSFGRASGGISMFLFLARADGRGATVLKILLIPVFEFEVDATDSTGFGTGTGSSFTGGPPLSIIFKNCLSVSPSSYTTFFFSRAPETTVDFVSFAFLPFGNLWVENLFILGNLNIEKLT